jgi:hypothetical protein
MTVTVATNSLHNVLDYVLFFKPEYLTHFSSYILYYKQFELWSYVHLSSPAKQLLIVLDVSSVLHSATLDCQ